jgi:hypothetical protein
VEQRFYSPALLHRGERDTPNIAGIFATQSRQGCHRYSAIFSYIQEQDGKRRPRNRLAISGSVDNRVDTPVPIRDVVWTSDLPKAKCTILEGIVLRLVHLQENEARQKNDLKNR